MTVPQLSHALARRVEGPGRPRGTWIAPEAVGPGEVGAVIAAAKTLRDRLLLRVLWATGGRVSEVLGLRAQDILPDSLVVRNLKNPARTSKRIFMSRSEADLPTELLLWCRERHILPHEPVFLSPEKDGYGRRVALSRQQAWVIVKDASRRAGVLVRAMRATHDGAVGDPAPLHPHILRHARVREIMRETRSLPLAMKVAGWSRLQVAYLTMSDDEAKEIVGRMEH